jgi:hypothetical protein
MLYRDERFGRDNVAHFLSGSAHVMRVAIEAVLRRAREDAGRPRPRTSFVANRPKTGALPAVRMAPHLPCSWLNTCGTVPHRR